MAEGGDEKHDNPFSFTKFVSQNGKDDDESSEERHEVFVPHPELPDISASASCDRRDPDNRRSNKDDRDNNPFSFKKFLQTGPSRNQGPNPLKTLDLAHDLPDFVQDHYTATCSTESPRGRHRNPAVGDVPLPDFTLDTEGSLAAPADSISPAGCSNHNTAFSHNGPVFADSSGAAHGPNVGRTYQPARACRVHNVTDNDLTERGADLEPEDTSDNDDRLCQPTGGLPDMLSDSGVTGAGARPKHSPITCQENSEPTQDLPQVDVLLLVQKFQEENKLLRNQLAEVIKLSNMSNNTESARTLDVAGDKSSSRDSEETAALELLVMKVEANLQTTTQRALRAESTVASLKKDVSHLQRQLQGLQTENEALRGGGPDPLRDQTHLVAAQLRTSADTAEQHLRQLMAGVDSLRMAADVLDSAEKVIDVSPSSDTESSPVEGGSL